MIISDQLKFYCQEGGLRWFLGGSHGFQVNSEGICHSQTDYRGIVENRVFFLLYFSSSPPFPSLDPHHTSHIYLIGVNHWNSSSRMSEKMHVQCCLIFHLNKLSCPAAVAWNSTWISLVVLSWDDSIRIIVSTIQDQILSRMETHLQGLLYFNSYKHYLRHHFHKKFSI